MGFLPTSDHLCSQMKDTHSLYIFKYSLGSTIFLNNPWTAHPHAAFLAITPNYHLLCFIVPSELLLAPIGYCTDHIFMVQLTHGKFSFSLLQVVLPLFLRLKPRKSKSHLCLFYPSISHWHLYSLIRNNLGQGHRGYVQTSGFGDHT